MIFQILFLFLFGTFLLFDSLLNKEILSQELVVKYLGKKFERYFKGFVGISMLIFGFLLLF